MKRLPIGTSILLGMYLASTSPGQTGGSGQDFMAGQPLGPPAPGIEAVRSPVRITVGPQGNLWATDFDRKKVLLIDPATLEVVLEFSVAGRPTALAVHADRVFVGNDDAGRIDVYDLFGYHQFSFATPVGQPNDIAVSPAHDRLYAVSSLDRLVHVFNLEGTLISTLPAVDAEELAHPTGVTLYQPPLAQDVNGDAVVNVLDLLDLLGAWGQGPGPADIDGDGQVTVVDLLDLLGNWSRTLEDPQVFVSDFGDADPDHLIDPAIRVYDVNGAHLKTISGVGRFSRPQGMYCDRQGQLFVADSLQCRILVFDRETGVLLRTLGGFGPGAGQLNIPLGLHVDESNGDVFVADNRNGRIAAFRQGGVAP